MSQIEKELIGETKEEEASNVTREECCDKFIFSIFSLINIFVGINGLVELPKFEVTDLITTEEIIRNSTNSVLASLKLAKPVNFTRIRDYATTHNYFVSLTLRDSETLNEIARLTRVDKGNNKTEVDLTTILNEFLEENSFEFIANDVGIDDCDASVANYINHFLAKLEQLKENFGVNKVFSDINANIIRIFRSAKKTFPEKNEFANITNDTIENFDIFHGVEFLQESGRRIFKGKRTKIKYFPFMASVHIFNSFQCAGSIIKSDIIITASSCLQLAWNNRLYRENPAFLSVRVGSSFYSGGGDNIPVLEAYFHPEYNPKNLHNNLCLMRLVRHIKFRQTDSKRVRKISIDTEPSNMPINIPGITILGWGAKGIGGGLHDPWDNILSYAFLDVYPLKDCQEVFAKEYVTNKNFCAGFFSKGGGACNRDVGAPGVVDGLLMGVVSFGSPVCGTPDVPTVFTKLGYYYEWIKNIMSMDIPRGLKGTTLQRFIDPYAPYMTTQHTRTTFKLEPLGIYSKPRPALEEDDEIFLRNLDGNVFQEFLRTMFGDDEPRKYQYLMDQMKKKELVTEMKKYYEKINKTGEENNIIGHSQIPKPVLNEDHSIDVPYQPLTSGYDSENYLYPSTMQNYIAEDETTDTTLTFTHNESVDEEDYPVTEATRGKPKLYYETQYIPMTQHSKDFARNIEMANVRPQNTKAEQFNTLRTTPLPALELELAMESSEDESDDSESDDKDNISPIKGVGKESHSSDVSDVPAEETLTKLLNEIDLDHIIEEVSTDTKKPQPESNRKPKPVPVSKSFAPRAENVKNKVKNYNNIDLQGKRIDESVLTLLYLANTENKKNNYMDSGNFGDTVKYNLIPHTTPHNVAPRESVYRSGQRGTVYKIISEVLNDALENKNDYP